MRKAACIDKHHPNDTGALSRVWIQVALQSLRNLGVSNIMAVTKL